MSEIQRYDAYYKDDFGYILEALRRKNPDGEYVLYADYEPIAKRVQELEEVLRGLLNTLVEEFGPSRYNTVMTKPAQP